MEKEPFVSILTPVYNGEAFLDECMRSVLSQTYKNWEYVLVNNCSTDRTLQIIQKYIDEDTRIRVVNNDMHLPVMNNLNHAFFQISPESKYCKVIHSDDWMFPECISRMVDVAERYPNIGIVSSYYLDDRTVRSDGLPYPSHYNCGRNIARQYLLNSHKYFGAPSNLLIKSDLIRRRPEFYDPANIHSDHTVCLDMLRESDFGFVHQVLTYSRRHNDSHTKKVAEKLGTYELGSVKNLMAHGVFFLEPAEHKKRLTYLVDSYYNHFVLKSIFSLSKKIYDFHTGEIRKIGLKVNHLKIFKITAFTVLNPRFYVRLVGKIAKLVGTSPGKNQ